MKLLKKLLDKIMARLGYVPRLYLYAREIEVACTTANFIADDIKSGIGDYFVRATPKSHDVVYRLEECAREYLIKTYPFNDDPDFAKLLAEELCEKLNERH